MKQLFILSFMLIAFSTFGQKSSSAWDKLTIPDFTLADNTTLRLQNEFFNESMNPFETTIKK